jgi:putative spermidine/putrescine transport system permease protein
MWSKNNESSTWYLWLKILPAFLVISTLFLGGILLGLLQSVGLVFQGNESTFTLDAYERMFTSEDFWFSMIYSLRTVLISTVLASALGLLFVLGLYILRLRGAGNQLTWLRYLWQVPFLIPHLVAAYAITLLFMPSGWLARWSVAWGWLDSSSQFPIVVQDAFGWGIILSYTWKEAPFVVLMLLPIIYRIHTSWYEVGRTYGAHVFKFVISIVIPLLLPALSLAAFIIFAFMLSSYEIPYVLGVTYPKFISVYGFESFQSIDWADRQFAIAIYVWLACMTIGLGILVYIMNRKWLIRHGKSW